MALDVHGYNFADTPTLTWTLTADNPVTGVVKVEGTVTGGGGGTTWYVGAGVPTTLHNNGDFYLRTTNGEVYQQVSGAWVDQGFSLIGPTGATGAPGPTGPTGPAGATGAAGPGAVDYIGDWSSSVSYLQGNVARYNGVDYLAVNPSTGQTPPPAGSGLLPPVVNGQWVKGVGGATVWAAIKAADLTQFATVMVAGYVASTGTAATGSSGFTSSRASLGNYTITLTTAMVSPVLLLTAATQSIVIGGAFSSTTVAHVYVTTPSAWIDSDFQFLAIDRTVLAQ